MLSNRQRESLMQILEKGGNMYDVWCEIGAMENVEVGFGKNRKKI